MDQAINQPEIELTPPDIGRWRLGNTGIHFVSTFDSGKAGPHVMINAITHGNEFCGAIAVDRLLSLGVRPARGRLTLSFGNVDALARFDPSNPHASRYVDEDLNRVWSSEVLDGPRTSRELRRARELRVVLDDVDFLLELHSMHDPHPPILLAGPLNKGLALCESMRLPYPIVINRLEHPQGPMLRDYGSFGDPASARAAALVECGWHWEAAAAQVAWQSAWSFLRATGIMEPDLVAANAAAPATGRPMVVTVDDQIIARTDDFKLRCGLNGLDVLHKGDLIGLDGGVEIVAPFDDCVLIMPARAGAFHVRAGLAAVRLGRLR